MHINYKSIDKPLKKPQTHKLKQKEKKLKTSQILTKLQKLGFSSMKKQHEIRPFSYNNLFMQKREYQN